jgi:hypothetical protein
MARQQPLTTLQIATFGSEGQDGIALGIKKLCCPQAGFDLLWLKEE